MDIDPHALAAYAATFISRYDRYALQRPDGSYRAVTQRLSLTLVQAHMLGEITLGAYALDEQSRARWLCLDADDEASWGGVLELARQLDQPSYIEQSRRGGHLWLFFEQAVPGKDARRLGKWLLAEHGLAEVELYPKQDELRTGPGSLVRLPLGIHQKSQKRYAFITPEGELLAPTARAQLAILAWPERVAATYVQDVLARLPEPRRVFPTPRLVHHGEVTSETPSERIKSAVSVYDFVSQFVDLDRNGRGYCPFHDDHHMSFGVNEEHNFWNCFAGCGGGSVIDFYMKWRELNGEDASFAATVAELARLLL